MPSDVTPKAPWRRSWPEPAIKKLEELTGIELRAMELVEFAQNHPDVPDFLFDWDARSREDDDSDTVCTSCGQRELLTPDGYCRLCLVVEFGYWRANRQHSEELLEFALERARADYVDIEEFIAKARS